MPGSSQPCPVSLKGLLRERGSLQGGWREDVCTGTDTTACKACHTREVITGLIRCDSD